MPDFKAHPALCAFDMDGRDSIAFIPSEFLKGMLLHRAPLLPMLTLSPHVVVPTGPKKVQFVLKDQLEADQLEADQLTINKALAI